MLKKHLIFALLFMLMVCELQAQSFYSVRRDRSIIATVGLNTSTYYGDLKDNADFLDAKPSLSLGLMYFVSKRIGVRGEFSWVTLSGSDAKSNDEGRIKRNLSFTSNNYEFAISSVINLVPQGGKFYQRPKFNLYGIIGVGGLYFNPKADLNGTKYALEPLHTEGTSYSRFAFVIPFGLGAKARLTPFINLALEAGWRKTFTDYIDDVSDKYVANSSFTNPIAKQLADRRPEIGLPVLDAGHKRGDPTNKDAYMLFTAKIEYYLPYQILGTGGQRKLYNKKRKAIYHR